MHNSFAFKTIGILVLLSTIAFLLPLIGFDAQLANAIFGMSLSIAQILSVMLLLKNGTLLGSPWFKAVLVFLVLILLSVAFKVLHWPFADILLILGSIGVVIVYSLYFMAKINKSFLAVLKLIWTATAFVGGTLIVLYRIPNYYMWVSTVVLFIAVLIFYQEQQSLKEK